jgi:hypothetical protein
MIFCYSRSDIYTFHRLREARETPKRQQKRVWHPETGTLKQAREEAGELIYYTETERTIDDVWRIPYLMPADRMENVGFLTQNHREIVERILQACSNEGDLVLDCFVKYLIPRSRAFLLKRARSAAGRAAVRLFSDFVDLDFLDYRGTQEMLFVPFCGRVDRHLPQAGRGGLRALPGRDEPVGPGCRQGPHGPGDDGR